MQDRLTCIAKEETMKKPDIPFNEISRLAVLASLGVLDTDSDEKLDRITRIHNRKGFVEIAEKALRLCKRDGIESSLCFMDLNRFKEINDKYGHDEGDRVLISFSNIIRKESRDSDIVGRLGGDEFVVWLYKSGETAACQYVERVKETIKNVYSSLEKPYRVDFAHGIVEIPGNSDIELEEAFKMADAEMYKSKGKERNLRRGGIGE
jgi:diguanylate cyclase (GGDEF)-like protein